MPRIHGLPVPSFVKPMQAPSQKKKDTSLIHTSYTALEASIKDQAKNWLKLGNATSYWVGRALYEVPPQSFVQFGKDMGQFKNILSSWEVLTKTPELLTAAGRALTEKSAHAAYRTIVTFANWFTSFSDGLSWMGRYCTVLAKLPGVAVVHSAATFTYAADGMMEQCGKMVEAKTEEQKVLALLKLSMNVSYTTLGVLTFSASMLWTASNAHLVMICFSFGTLFGLLSYFYEKMYDPLNANESVNWDKMKKNIRLA